MNIAKVKEKPSVSKSAKEMIQTAPKELLRRGLLDGTEKLRGQLRDAAEGGRREEDVSDRAHGAAVQGSRLAADKLGKLTQSGRKNRDKMSDCRKDAPPTAPQGENFREPPTAPSKEPHAKQSVSSVRTEPLTVQSYTEPVRIKTRESTSSFSPLEHHGPTRTRVTAPSPSQPMVKTKQNYIQRHADRAKDASPGIKEQRDANVSQVTSSTEAPRPQDMGRRESIREKGRIIQNNRVKTPHSAENDVQPQSHASSRGTIKTKETYIQQHQPVESVNPSTPQTPTHPSASSPVNSQIQGSSPGQIRGREKFIREQRQKSAIRQAEPNIQHGTAEHPLEAVKDRSSKAAPASSALLSQPGVQPGSQTGAQTNAQPIGSAARGSKTGIRSRGKTSMAKAPRSAVKTENQTARQTIKTAECTTKKIVKTVERGSESAKNGIKATQKTIQTAAKAPRRAVQAARATAKTAATSAKAVAKTAMSAIKAAIAAAQELAAAIAACGGAVVVVVLILCLVAAILMSPLGVFLSGEENGGNTIASVIQEINLEYEEKIEELKVGVTCDEVSLSGSRAPWPEILAVYAVKITSNPTNGQEVVTMNDSKKEVLKQVFWDMNELSSFTSTVPGGEGEEDTTTLHITVMAKTADEMADIYGFSAEQRQQLAELLSNEHQDLWGSVLYGIGTGDGEIVAVALSQVGNIGGQPYWSWYGFAYRVDWCAIFVSWCANQCGYIDAGVAPKFAGCVQGTQWFKNRGLWQNHSYTPNPGDLIFFDWDDPGGFSGPQDSVPDHVGIVERVENGRVYTVEGNSGDKCCQRSYPVGYYEIYGYGAICP